MSEVLAWMTPERLNALAMLIGALSALYHVVVNVRGGWSQKSPQEKWSALMEVATAAHDAVERLGPLANGTKAERYVALLHKLCDAAGLDKPDPQTAQALGTAIHEAAKADALAAGMAADPQQPGA